MNQYHQILATVDQKSDELSSLLNYDIRGITDSIKQQLKEKLEEVDAYKQYYENVIAPQIVAAVENQLNNTFLNSLKTHAQALKKHLDSNIFSPMELHPETDNPQLISRWPIFVFLATAVLCLLFSTVFHIFHPLSSSTPALS